MLALGIMVGGFIAALYEMLLTLYNDRKTAKTRVCTILKNGDVTFNKKTGTYSVEWKGNTVWNDGKYIYFESCWGYEAIFNEKSRFGIEIANSIKDRIINNIAE